VNGARKLAVVNQTFVKKYLGNENPHWEASENRAARGV